MEDTKELKVKAWLLNKSTRDKAIELMSKLDKTRAEEENSVIEVGITLLAIDIVLGLSKGRDEKINTQTILLENENKEVSIKKSIKKVWMKWMCDYHTFNNVILTNDDITQFSPAVKEYIDKEKDENNENWNYILPSLKYSQSTVSKQNEKPKPLTSDQKLQNTIFLRCCSNIWKLVIKKLNNRLDDFVDKMLKDNSNSNQNIDSQLEGKNDGKFDDTEETKITTEPYELITQSSKQPSEKYETLFYHEIGIKRLKQWAEEDEDKQKERDRIAKEERLFEAKLSHEQFVKLKDSLRIRMPEGISETIAPAPVMTYGNTSSLKSKTKINGSLTTVELMANSGLKYVHATSRGKQGIEGDLEKSKKQLIRKGLIERENFDSEDAESEFYRDKFLQYKEEHPLLNEQKDFDKKFSEETSKAYETWLNQKNMRDTAIKYLSFITFSGNIDIKADSKVSARKIFLDSKADDKPTTELNKSSDQNQFLRSAVDQPLVLNKLDDEKLQYCFKIGQALKQVDRTLYSEWCNWCNRAPISANMSSQITTFAWDCFEPKSCDIHSLSYSKAREAFLKLVKTGCDYQKTFIEFAEKVCKRKNNQDINLYGSVEDKNKVLSEIYLSKNQTNELLLQMGISMKQSDLLILIDSFDVNGDGKITLQEFMDFVGPKRATNSGSSVILSQKCVWFTTCRETGMANAYSVTNVIKNKEAPSAEAKDIREGNDQLDEKSSYLEPTFVDKTKIESDNNNSRNNLTFYKTLKSGQRRLYIENNERKLRLSVLKKCGLLKQERKNSNLSADSKANAEDENYQDHFEDYQDEDNEDGVNVSKNMKDDTRKTGCSYIRQSAEDKLKALKLLAEESKINRKEKLVQNLMTEGSPPQPPKFWVICDPVVVETKESGGTSTRQSSQRSNAKNYILNSKSRLEIHWEPSKSDDVISFYTIDCSGPTNNRSVRGDNFKEIYRDPPDAHPNNKAKTCYLFDNLQFGTSYSFRIRAYNGFGPSEYVYKVFTTLCNQPLTPNIISCSSSSVELRWLFDEIYMQEMIKLKSIFRIIDKDGSGTITREELVAVLDDKSSDVIGRDSRKFLKKVSKSLGLDPNQGYAALFDMIESDDDGVLTWQEFEQFFLNAGWITSCVPDSSDDKSLDIISSLPLTLKNDNNNNSNNDDVHSVTSISSRGINSRMNVSRRQGTSLRSKFTPNRSVSKTDGHILAGGSISSSSHSIRSGKPQLTSTRISTCPQVTKKITYVIEQCISDIDNSYKEVLKTSSGYGIISNLQPGTSYRFRVYAMNCEGQKSSPSNSVVVHTLLITPSPPTPVDIKPNQILLKWKPLNSQENRRSKDTIDKVLTDWASLHNLKERGVSVEAAFTKYDKDKNGTIDAHELAYLLEDLGINPTEDKLLDALREFDQNGDGLVSFEEFCQWWRKGSIVYTIKISEPILPRSILLSSIDSSDDYDRNINQIDSDKDENDCPEYEDDLSFSLFSDKKEKKQDKKMRALTKPPSYDEIAYKISKLLKNGDSELSSSNIQVPMPTVAYRGGNTKTTVSSLLPNRLYHIKIRASTSYSHSQLSDPLEFMTQPLPIQSQPILVMMSCNTIRIKWYPSKYGAYKYEVQLTKLIEGKSSTTNWTSVYSGLDNNYVNTTMTPGTSYALRVFGINYFGIYSEPSIPLIFTTPDRSISGERLNIPSSKKTTESVFNIECTGDICIGDTILITERLYATKTVSYTPRKSLILPTNASTISEQISQQSIKLKSFRKKNLNNGNRELGKTIQDSISLAEPASITNGVCIGERVITAHVIKDNYRTIREYAPTKFMLQNSDIDQTQQDIESKIKASEDICTKSISKLSNSISKQDCQKVSYNRNLWLEIIWQKTNTTAPIESLKAFELNNGMIIQRIQSDIEQFEIYRQPWVEENKRLPLYQEWTTLSECYIPVNHNSSFN